MVDEVETPVDVSRDYPLTAAENLPNHSSATRGQTKFVRVGPHISSGDYPIFRTKQSAYRFAGWLLTTVERHGLPDEDGAHSFEQVMEAIRKA